MTTINRILYATDLSSTSEPAWDETRRLGRLFNAEILVLHAVAPPLVFPVEGYFPPDLYEELLRNARRDAEKAFDRLLGSVAGSGLKVRIRLEEGPPASRILEVASQEAADLLVVGTHSRTGVQRAMLGSVADRMVRQATCPVLTVRPRPESAPRREIRRICYATDFSPTAPRGRGAPDRARPRRRAEPQAPAGCGRDVRALLPLAPPAPPQDGSSSSSNVVLRRNEIPTCRRGKTVSPERTGTSCTTHPSGHSRIARSPITPIPSEMRLTCRSRPRPVRTEP
jgi:nucleotide-binding universal stress UspA family protein